MGPGKARETLSCARPRSRRPGTRGPKRRGTAPSAGRPGGAPGPRLAAGGEVPGLLCSRTSVPRGLLWPGTSDCTEREGEREAVLGRKRGARGTVSKGLLDVETEERNGPGTLPGRVATGGGFLRGSRSRVHLQRQRGVVSAPLSLSITHCALTTPSSLPAPRASLRRPGRRDGPASRSAQLLAAGRCAPGCACVCTRACVCVEGGGRFSSACVCAGGGGGGEIRQCPWRHRSRLPIESRNRGAAGPCPGQKARTAQAQSAPAACSHAASNGSPDSGKLPCDKARKTQTKWRER